MRLAVIADIHGNVLALEAVLADIARRGAEMTIDLGDCVSGPLWPAETYEVLRRLQLPTVRGNHDRALGTLAAKFGLSDAFAADALARAERLQPGGWETLAVTTMPALACQALAALPVMCEPVPGVVAFHGTPEDDTVYLLEDIVDGALALAAPGTIARRLGAVDAPLILCGHSHQPRLVHSGDSVIVNPGSVGCAAYADPTQPAHRSETGSPHARYAIVDDSSGAWAVEFMAVVYDWAAAADRAASNNRPEWAGALRSGRVR